MWLRGHRALKLFQAPTQKPYLYLWTLMGSDAYRTHRPCKSHHGVKAMLLPRQIPKTKATSQPRSQRHVRHSNFYPLSSSNMNRKFAPCQYKYAHSPTPACQTSSEWRRGVCLGVASTWNCCYAEPPLYSVRQYDAHWNCSKPTMNNPPYPSFHNQIVANTPESLRHGVWRTRPPPSELGALKRLIHVANPSLPSRPSSSCTVHL